MAKEEEKDVDWGGRLRGVREARGITQGMVAAGANVSLPTIQRYEAGWLPSGKTLNKLVKYYKCNKSWLLAGEGVPFPDRTGERPEPSPQPSIYNKDAPALPESIAEMNASYMPAAGIDPALQAMSDIKDIFASGDPILVPAIRANIIAFKRALYREHQIVKLVDENRALNARIAKLELLCDEFKRQLEIVKEDNRLLREENLWLKGEIQKLKGQSGGSAPIDLAPDAAAHTGTDDQEA